MMLRTTLLATACVFALAACGDEAPPPAPADTLPATTAQDATEPTTTPAAEPTDVAATGGTETTDTGAATAGAAPPDDGTAAVVTDCSTTIGSNDAMRYDVSSLAIPSSCTEFTIRLEHNGQMPVAAMGHDVVIASRADMPGVLADGMAAGLDNDYVKPGDPRVIAHTDMVGGGESTAVTFPVAKLEGGGPWEFFCSFPGHAALMKGTVTVE